ncbi:MAG: SGNH/GDSL hydrolase family protein [Winogradskyella sp.]|nr:SGNH/GDSL hydrolase family protein [Winogradskyella sp.]MBT8376139.1 SGNH/GDSL hydrolase family protein [Bacteroidia bacterium]NNF85965.1 SGNH/GDSL hydrolase family protein [Winogradskyella sp.]NNK39913.1 SGNH/GDSL hydrolase family protein [Winogradskyella sp.]NNL81791.1 SGNH/GDSL hydrolase family protein [Winogradskyella sp.]
MWRGFLKWPLSYLVIISLFLLDCTTTDDNRLFVDPNTNSNNSNGNTDTTPETITLKYLALGDSYTIGTSVCDTCNYPIQLKDSLSELIDPIYNTSVEIIATAGWTTTNLLNAISAAEPDNDHDLVTLLIGVNNQFQGKPFEIYETEFNTIVERAIAFAGNDKDRVIVLSIPDYAYTPFGQNFGNATITSLEIDFYNNYAENYCANNGISYVYITDISREGLDIPYLVASDGLHLSELAYSLFVQRLLPVVRQKIE